MIKFINKHKELIIAILLVALLYLFFGLIGIGCPIKFLTGISCPGCGMTRAFKSLIMFDLKSAFYYHPGFILIIIAVIVIVIKKRINYNLYKTIMSLIVIGLLLIYIVRIINGNEVVEYNPKNGLIYKTISIILGK